jgi:hypothetical protein
MLPGTYVAFGPMSECGQALIPPEASFGLADASVKARAHPLSRRPREGLLGTFCMTRAAARLSRTQPFLAPFVPRRWPLLSHGDRVLARSEPKADGAQQEVAGQYAAQLVQPI